MTAAELLAATKPFGPSAGGGELVFEADPPGHLAPLLAVLHTGVRALLTGRTWWCCADDGRRPTVFALDPEKVLPARVGLLCVEGDSVWDRVRPDTPVDLPELFGAASLRGVGGDRA